MEGSSLDNRPLERGEGGVVSSLLRYMVERRPGVGDLASVLRLSTLPDYDTAYTFFTLRAIVCLPRPGQKFKNILWAVTNRDPVTVCGPTHTHTLRNRTGNAVFPQ